MVVMLVLGMVLSLASVVLPDRRSAQLANEASRLVKVLDTLQTEAMLQHTQAGLMLDEQGYRAYILNLHTLAWESSELKILGEHPLQDKGLQLALVESVVENESAAQQPGIVFDSSGVSDPFQLRLVDSSGLSATLGSDGYKKAVLQ
jgi:type II secretory pathway pseudopilin PulG